MAKFINLLAPTSTRPISQREIDEFAVDVAESPRAIGEAVYTEVAGASPNPQRSNTNANLANEKTSISRVIQQQIAQSAEINNLRNFNWTEQQARMQEASRRSNIPMSVLIHRPDLIDAALKLDGSSKTEEELGEYLIKSVDKNTSFYRNLQNDPRLPVLALTLDNFLEQDDRVRDDIRNSYSFLGQTEMRWKMGFQQMRAYQASKDLLDVRARDNATPNEIWLAEQRRDRQFSLLSEYQRAMIEGGNIVSSMTYGAAAIAPQIVVDAGRSAILSIAAAPVGVTGTIGRYALNGARALFLGQRMYTQEAGAQYQEFEELRQEGLNISEQTAARYSRMYGLISGALEMVQFEGIIRAPFSKSIFKIPGFGPISQTGKLATGRFLASAAGQAAANLIGESITEAAQEATSMSLTNVAARLDGEQNVYTADEILQRTGDTFKATLNDMFLLVVPGSLVGSFRGRRDQIAQLRTRVQQNIDHQKLLDTNIEYAGKQRITELQPVDAAQVFDELNRSHDGYVEAFVPAQTILDAIQPMSDEQKNVFLKENFSTTLDVLSDAANVGEDLPTTIGALSVMANRSSAVFEQIRGQLKASLDGISYSQATTEAANLAVQARVMSDVVRIETTADNIDSRGSVVIPADAYEVLYQRDPEQMATELGISPEAATRIINENSDVEVNTDVLRNPDLSPERRTLLLQIIRDIETGRSYEEALAAYREELRDHDEIVDLAQTELNSLRERISQVRGVQLAYEMSLASTGLTTETARSTSSILANYIDTRSRQIGLTPNEYYDLFGNINFVRTDVEGARGSIQFSNSDTPVTITISRNADASTAIHELAHFFLFDTKRLSEQVEDNTVFINQLNAISSWVGEDLINGNLTEEVQERFADAFVQYLQEGRLAGAPTSLKSAFRSFKTFLQAAYGANLIGGVELSENAKQIFESMILVEEDRQELETLQSVLRIDGTVGDEDIDSVLRTLAQNQELVVEDAANKTLRDNILFIVDEIVVEDSDDYKLALRAAKTELSATINYSIINELQNNPGVRFNIGTLIDLYGREVLDGLPDWAMTDRQSVMTPDMMANQTGFDSGLDVINMIKTTPDLNTAAREAALNAVRYQGRGEGSILFSTLEDRLITDSSQRPMIELWQNIQEHVANYSAVNTAEQRARIKVQAKVLKNRLRPIAVQSVKNIDVNQLRAKIESAIIAKTRNALLAQEAIRAKNWDRAADLTNRAIMAGLIAVEAKKAMRRSDVFKNKINKIKDIVRRIHVEDGNIKYPHLAQAEQLLRTYGFLQSGTVYRPVIETLQNYIDAQQAQMRIMIVPQWILSSDNAGNISRGLITFGQLDELANTIEQIYKAGLDETSLSKKYFRQNLIDTVTSINDQSILSWSRQLDVASRRALTDIEAGETSTRRSTLRTISAAVVRYASIFKALDAGTARGLWTDNFVRPIQEALIHKDTLSRKYLQGIEPAAVALFEGMSDAQQRKWNDTKNVMLNGRAFSRQQLVALILNNGTVVNQERVLTGEGWTMEQMEAAYGLLTSKELDLVEAIWKTAEDAFVDVLTQEVLSTGDVVRKKQNFAFEATELDTGKTRAMPGGYIPIIYDYQDQRVRQAFLGNNIDVDSTRAALKDPFADNDPMYPTTSHGYVNTAAKSTKIPLDYNLGRILHHFNQVANDVAMRNVLKDVYKLSRNGAIEALITNILGREYYDQILPTLQYLARDGAGAPVNDFMRALNRLGGKVAQSLISFNVMSAFRQPLGFFAALPDVGSQRLGQQIVETAKVSINPIADGMTREQIARMSPYMRDRLIRSTSDMNDLSRAFSHRTVISDINQKYNHIGMALMGATDGIVSQIVWRAYYDKAISELNYSNVEAVHYADLGVQGSQDTSDQLSKVALQREPNPFSAFLTQFQSAGISSFNGWWLTWQRSFASDISRAEIVGQWTRAFLYRYLTYSWAKRFMQGERPDENKEETWGTWLLRSVSSPAVVASTLGDFLPGGGNLETGIPTGSMSLPLFTRPLTSAYKAAQQLYVGAFSDNETDWRKFSANSAEAISAVTGFGGGITLRRAINLLGSDRVEQDRLLLFKILGFIR